MNGNNNNNNDGCIGGIALILMSIFALPFIGLQLLISSESETRKTVGIILLIVAVVIWIIAGISGN